MDGKIRRSLSICIALACLSSGVLAQAQLNFDIPAQPASEAIRKLARQSGLQVAALPADLSGIKTNAVHGTYAPMDALRLLIKDTGLAMEVTEGNSVTIHRDDSEPAPKPVGASRS